MTLHATDAEDHICDCRLALLSIEASSRIALRQPWLAAQNTEHGKQPSLLKRSDAVRGACAQLFDGLETQETCTQYNALKVARAAFLWTGDPRFADLSERLLLNGIVGAQRPALAGGDGDDVGAHGGHQHGHHHHHHHSGRQRDGGCAGNSQGALSVGYLPTPRTLPAPTKVRRPTQGFIRRSACSDRASKRAHTGAVTDGHLTGRGVAAPESGSSAASASSWRTALHRAAADAVAEPNSVSGPGVMLYMTPLGAR